MESEKKNLLESLGAADPGGSSTKQSTLAEVGELMENELQCSICAELFVAATTLNCSHTFCKYCITMWKKKKKDCPICRWNIFYVNDDLLTRIHFDWGHILWRHKICVMTGISPCFPNTSTIVYSISATLLFQDGYHFWMQKFSARFFYWKNGTKSDGRNENKKTRNAQSERR